MTESTGTGSLDNVKTHHRHTFSSTKLLTRVTVADKLVLVKTILMKYFVHCLMRCLFAFSSLFVQRTSLTVNIDLSDITTKYYTVLYRASWYMRKKSIIGVQWFQKNPNPQVNRSVGNSASLVSHWNGGPSGWDFSVPTEHQ